MTDGSLEKYQQVKGKLKLTVAINLQLAISIIKKYVILGGTQ
ncbi:hypothetical protein [Lysinibacillus sp. NPDC093688]